MKKIVENMTGIVGYRKGIVKSMVDKVENMIGIERYML